MQRTPRELERFVRRQLSARTCENLMGRFCFYGSTYRADDILAMWSHAEDTRIELPWGVYDGFESVKRHFTEEMPRHDDLEGRRGRLDMQGLNCMQMVIAEDNRTARAAWMSIGIETQLKNGKPQCRWNFVKFGVDFIMEEGEWKIWHMAVYTLMKTGYYESWEHQKKLEIADFLKNGYHPDRQPTIRTLWNMTPEKTYPCGQPVPPKPYDRFDMDVGYGY